jgi:hypothetical protein
LAWRKKSKNVLQIERELSFFLVWLLLGFELFVSGFRLHLLLGLETCETNSVTKLA